MSIQKLIDVLLMRVNTKVVGADTPNYDYESFILHGTNLYFIQDIARDGLSGRLNDELYMKMKSVYSKTPFTTTGPYVKWFFERQDSVRNNPLDVSLSFTGQQSVAEEYSKGARLMGEGISKFYAGMVSRIYGPGSKQLDQDFISLFDTLKKISNYPGIILAILAKEEFPFLKDPSEHWELVVHKPIPPERLFIQLSPDKYIKLTSTEGSYYIQKLLSEVKQPQPQDLPVSEPPPQDLPVSEPPAIGEWRSEKSNTNVTCKVDFYNIDNPARSVHLFYDSLGEDRGWPHYMNVSIMNGEIGTVRLEITHSPESVLEYKVKVVKSEGNRNLVVADSDIKDKLQEAVNYMTQYVPADRFTKMWKLATKNLGIPN